MGLMFFHPKMTKIEKKLSIQSSLKMRIFHKFPNETCKQIKKNFLRSDNLCICSQLRAVYMGVAGILMQRCVCSPFKKVAVTEPDLSQFQIYIS